jgi:hypothetical protein
MECKVEDKHGKEGGRNSPLSIQFPAAHDSRSGKKEKKRRREKKEKKRQKLKSNELNIYIYIYIYIYYDI